MSPSPTIHLTMPAPDIAQLSFDVPDKGVNILSAVVLDELAGHLDQLEKRTDLAGLILISGKPGSFIAGADVREFAEALQRDDHDTATTIEVSQRGQKLFSRLSEGPFVSVAAIDGICVGGGAELAIWCDRRILSDNVKTQYGFPEVKLGLFPGWGGTVRAPRIAGLSNALELVTGGESIDAEEAFAMGLADDLVPAEQLQQAALNLIRAEQASGDFRRDRERWKQPINISETEFGFLAATASAVIQQKTKGQYPAPVAALNQMLESTFEDAERACRMESESFAELFGSAVNRSLLNVFFLTDRNKKDTGLDDDGVTPRDISSVGVVGAGIMGAGIAAANVKRDIPVVLSDANRTALDKGVRTALEEVSYNKKTKATDAERMLKFSPLLNPGVSDEELSQCALLVEAVVESADVKRKIYARLEPQLRDDTILASNTSTIPITSLAEVLDKPERFCGIHFFNPVRRMPLVEVIRGEKTSDETVATAVAYAKRIGKSPIVVNDGPGFLVNRLLLPYMNEAIELLCEGASIKAVDRAAKKFGMPMGPIELFDMVGMDTAMLAGRTMWEAFPDRIVASPVLPAMVKANRLGKKSGLGFFSYQNKRGRPEPDPGVDEIIAQYARDQKEFNEEELTSRLFLPMLLEATRVLEAGVARDPRDVDLGLIFGLGFPPFKGGLMFWADTVGAKEILEMLKPLDYLGARAEPTPMLIEMANEGRKFYG